MLIPTKFNGFVESRRLYFKGGGSSDARKMEQERQARVDAAVKAINDIFDPQPYVTVDLDNRVTSYDPSQTYYLADGSVFDPTSTRTEIKRTHHWGSGAKPFEGRYTTYDPVTVTYTDWDKINNAIASGALYGSKTVTPDGREKLYEDQRDAVYEINSREVNRHGLMGGSADVDSNARLQEITNEGLMKASGIADSAAASLRAKDESARQNLISMAQSGIDTGTAQKMAVESLDSTSQEAQGARSGASVGDLFGGLSQAYLRYNNLDGSGTNLFNTGNQGSSLSTRSSYGGNTSRS